LSAILILIGVLLLGAVYLTRERASPPVPQDDEKDRRTAEQQQLDQERKKLEEERAGVERQKQQLEFTRLKGLGLAALAKKSYDEAEKAFRDALKLQPTDEEVLKGLVDAKAARTIASRGQSEDDKRGTEAKRLLTQGREAMANKQYASALQIFENLCQLAPGDAEAARARSEARDALDKDTTEKKKLADYELHMKAGQVAMAAQRYPDAIREFLAAQRVVPGDLAALAAQRQVENLIVGVQNQEQRRALYNDLMERSRTALRERRYEQANDTLTTALRLFPKDLDATKAMAEVKQGLNQAKGEYDRLMAQGSIALAAQRLEAAVRCFTEAGRVLPGDAAAAKAEADAERLLADLQAGQAAYLRYMTQGGIALQAKRFADAVLSYTEALRLIPNDPTALQGLRDAQQGLKDAKAAADQLAQNRAEYDKQMKLAANAMTIRQWPDAIRAYTAALQAIPDDPQATAGLHKAKYSKAMADGTKALAGRRQADAISAFEDALKEIPNDPAAQRGLQQAKALKK
jgi:tetratricopeptide (TPR) repeat protein